MPWSKVPGSEVEACEAGQTAVIKDEDEEVEGCHDTEEEADDQLAALNASENSAMDALDKLERLARKADVMDLSEGDLVQWDSSGGMAYGRVDEIAMEGSLESSLRDEPMDASEDSPAVRVELVDATEDGIEGRGETVLHRPGTLSMASEDDVKAAAVPAVKSSVGAERTMGFQTKEYEIKQDDDGDEFVFTAYGAVFGNKDRGGDILRKGAFKRTIKQNDGRFPLVADHNLGDMQSRLGVAYAQEDQKGVRVKGHVNTDTQAGREVASHIRHAQKHDLPVGMSFGYKVRDDDFDKEKDARILKEVQNYEFTVTSIPMNEQARVQGVKAILDDEEALRELERVIKSRLLDDSDFVSRLAKAGRDSEPASDSASSDSVAELTSELKSLKSELQSNG